MITGAELSEMAALQEQWMPDTGRLLRKTGSTFNPTTNQNTDTTTTVYEGIGRALAHNAASGQVSAEDLLAIQPYLCAIPLTAPAVQKGDVWITDTSADPRLVGLRLRVESVPSTSYPTCRHFIATEAQ
jgi:hypothetical protein